MKVKISNNNFHKNLFRCSLVVYQTGGQNSLC